MEKGFCVMKHQCCDMTFSGLTVAYVSELKCSFFS